MPTTQDSVPFDVDFPMCDKLSTCKFDIGFPSSALPFPALKGKIWLHEVF